VCVCVRVRVRVCVRVCACVRACACRVQGMREFACHRSCAPNQCNRALAAGVRQLPVGCCLWPVAVAGRAREKRAGRGAARRPPTPLSRPSTYPWPRPPDPRLHDLGGAACPSRACLRTKRVVVVGCALSCPA